MADAAVSFVVERLGDLLMEKASSLLSVSGNIQRLQRELMWMQGFLKEVHARSHRDNRTIQNLVAEVRDLAHDAEDVIESHALAAESASEGGFITTLTTMFNSSNQVASEIDEFTNRINELGRRLQTYGIVREAGDGSGTQQQNLQLLRRRSYSHIAEQHVVGLDEDAEKIAAQLIEGAPRSLAVSICGMGGIGKTTLAKKVYANTRVRSHFRCFAWECVSQQCKIRDAWERILINLTSPSGKKRRLFSELEDDEVAKELYQLLMKEKCLVVLDDIWTKDAWDCLRAGFPDCNSESKILLTTRNNDVAFHVDPDCFIHSPRCLNESQSWELFLSVAIRHREEAGIIRFTFDENLEELGRTIVNRCGGLPLAIKTIGGNLQTKSSTDEWTKVCNNMVSHLSGIDNGPTKLEIMSLLALSYHDLPYRSKQCFLHFSQFPKDFIIPTNTIINIWVAESLLPKGSIGEEEPMVEVEDIAYEYLEDLVSRCMIQVEKWSSTGRIKSCCLHDLMRDLCIQEAKKENFFHAKHLEDRNDEASIHSTSTRKFCRLALYMKNSSSQNPYLNYERYDHVRSLLVFDINMNQVFINELHLVAMIRHFKYLRLLYLDGIKVRPTIPKEIGDLVHLRLLDLGSTWIERLPPSLGKLTQLLMLKLDHVDLNRKMPCYLSMSSIVENMHLLRHLYLPPKYFIFGDIKLSRLRNLQTLVNLPLSMVKTEDLVGLPSLRKLKLKSSNKDEFKRLVEMLNTSPNTTINKLQSLSVSFGSSRRRVIEITKVATSCPYLHKLKLSGPLVLDLPEGSQIFRQLSKLSLKYSNFVEDPMPYLGMLPSLRVLHLYSVLAIDTIMLPKNSFPYLRSLVLSEEEHLKEWIIEEGALPHLSFLKLNFCINLKTLPEGLKFLDSLQELQIDDMPQAFTGKIKRGGENFHKVENVPSLLVEIKLQEYETRGGTSRTHKSLEQRTRRRK